MSYIYLIENSVRVNTMKYLVLGSGLMGRAVAYDLLMHKDTEEIRLADIDYKRAKSIASWLKDPRVKPMQVDVSNEEQVLNAMVEIDTVIGCVSYTYNYQLTKAAINSGANFCDLGGNNAVVSKQFSLFSEAKRAQVTVMPDCGLAPGVASVIVTAGAKQFDSLEEIHIRVGGLPQHPKPPLNYSLIFSVQGLTNEYIEIAEVIRDGKVVLVEPLTEIEEIEFPKPFGKLEAFQTSGGTSTLPKTFLGKVKTLDYKTIRYKGHCEKMKAMLDIGFKNDKEIDFNGCKISPRKFFEKILVDKLTDENNKDVTLVRVEIIGYQNEIKKKLTYQIIDYYDEKNNLSSMMRMTAFPTAIIARMMALSEIQLDGVITQEFNVPPEKMLEELRKRDIKIEEKWEQL
ncbi:MAG TPA: saccharopine dehydrogenase C-terminal domain-containing protein [Candidatus Bathyarchaeia archaeon]|nr:saccharopine dehydrogenase C-terminal domain-containing protein [Candidatus Bathyarchaeia archaeon]